MNLRPPAMLRDLMALNYPKKSKKVRSIAIASILKKFDSAGMSLGALSPDAHETLAEAMNSMGVVRIQERVAKPKRDMAQVRCLKLNKLLLEDSG